MMADSKISADFGAQSFGTAGKFPEILLRRDSGNARSSFVRPSLSGFLSSLDRFSGGGY